MKYLLIKVASPSIRNRKTMPLDRSLWKVSFPLHKIPVWSCPYCNIGLLNNSKKNFKVSYDESSKESQKSEDFQPEWMTGKFLGILQCRNSSCLEKTQMLGIVETYQATEYDLKYSDDPYIEWLKPAFTQPSLKLFQIPGRTPKKVKKAIHESFKLVWLDHESCANKIRVVIEQLLDSRRVQKQKISSKKKKIKLKLHERIELFKLKNPAIGDSLMAIKWIGNSGSHETNSITKRDILDAFALLESVISKAYGEELKKLDRLTKMINKKKKPIGKTKSEKRWGQKLTAY